MSLRIVLTYRGLAVAINYDSLPFEWYWYKTAIMLSPRLTLRLNKWDIGFIGHDYSAYAVRGLKQVAYIMLPGLPQTQGSYGTVDEAKEAVEKAATWWFYHAEYRVEEAQQVKRISRTRSRQEPVRVRRTRAVQEEPVSRVRRSPRAM